MYGIAGQVNPKRAGGPMRRPLDLAGSPLTAALVALLAGTWLIAGVADLLRLPHGTLGLVDVAEVVTCVALAAALAARRRVPRLKIAGGIYVAWVLTGLVTHASSAAIVTALGHWLVLPLLALLIATFPPSEQRVRVLVAALFGLSALEWLITLIQSASRHADSVVGTFGPTANAVTAEVLLIAVCIGIAAFLVRAPYGRVALAGASILPLFSAWAFVKATPIFLPIVALATIVPLLALRRVSWRRAAVAFGAVVLASCLVLADYAVFHHDSFKTLTSTGAGLSYLKTASIEPPVAFGNVVVADFGNSTLKAVDGATALRVGNAAAGNYTAKLVATRATTPYAVAPGRTYRFVVSARSLTPSLQIVDLQIDWLQAGGGAISTSLGRKVRLSATGPGQQSSVFARAPAAAVAAVPKLAVVNRPPAGSALLLRDVRFAPYEPPVAFGKVVVANFGNSTLKAVPGATALRVGNAAAGNYTAKLVATRATDPYAVAPGKSYRFAASVQSLTPSPQIVDLQIDWLRAGGTAISTSLGPHVRLGAAGAGQQTAVSASAPAAAVDAVPKIAVVNGPPAGSALLLRDVRFAPGTGRGRPAPTVPVPPAAPAPTAPAPAPSAAVPAAVPGRLTQWRMARDAISTSLGRRLFGEGLGAATAATHLGLKTASLPSDNAAASYSDFGNLLVERGWVGVAIVAAIAAALVAAAIALLRTLPPGRWTTAVTAAIPGVVLLMAMYGMISVPLRSRPSALTFWLVLALGLGPLSRRALDELVQRVRHRAPRA
jgi:hypothetical protein